ncbi:MAG: hypothetical protein QM704_07335 [Anaeromyxobacteraceae bacterium]
MLASARFASARLAALALALTPALAMAQVDEEDAPDTGPRGLQLTVLGGPFLPTGEGPELGDLPLGYAFGGRLGWRFGTSYGLELEARRSATSRDSADQGRLDRITQFVAVPALRIFGSLGPVHTEGSVGLGVSRSSAHRTTTDATSQVVGWSTQRRMGLHVSGGAAIPLGDRIDLLAGVSYDGAYATFFAYNPAWIGGVTFEVGVRLNLFGRKR